MDTEPIAVVETKGFIAAANGCLTEEERTDAITWIAMNPEVGARIPGGGGIRKVRFPVRGRGKRGGVRIVYYFFRPTAPLFLLTVFAKNEKDNLSATELRTLARAAESIAETYGRKEPT